MLAQSAGIRALPKVEFYDQALWRQMLELLFKFAVGFRFAQTWNCV